MASSGPKNSRAFERYLAAMAREIKKIVGNVSDIKDADAAIARLSRYERALAKWADDTAFKMVTEADKINARNWVNWDKQQRAAYVRGRGERGQVLSNALRRERLTKPQNEMISALSKEAAGFIKSVPAQVREEIVGKAEEYRNGGIRSDEMIDYIRSRGEVSESRARLIARTEVSRADAILTQSRAESIGSTHYIWQTAEDGIVREDHRECNGNVYAWADPPMHDDGHAYHPGSFPNCRCVALPVIPEKFGVSIDAQFLGLESGGEDGVVPEAENAPEVIEVAKYEPPVEERLSAAFPNVSETNKPLMIDAFKDSPKKVVALLEKHGARLRNAARDPRGSYYRPGEKAIYIKSTHDDVQAKRALQHEMGHFINDIAAEATENVLLSSSPEFSKAMNKERLLVNGKTVEKYEFRVRMENAIKEPMWYNNYAVSDIFDNISKGYVSGGWSHGPAYYKKNSDHWHDEIFANLFTLESAKDTEAIEFLRGFFPETIAAFKKWLYNK
ncbi:hypothetical protein FACS1894216_01040 [Synergistales bacterium]|nr:hypothetical protein FACS1894216_01040 [Synergistales bacterium]